MPLEQLTESGWIYKVWWKRGRSTYGWQNNRFVDFSCDGTTLNEEEFKSKYGKDISHQNWEDHVARYCGQPEIWQQQICSYLVDS